MIEHNAVGTRVATRPMWILALMLFLLGPVYRIFWVWRANEDLVAFGRARTGGEAPAIKANPAAAATCMVLALPGWALISVTAVPWGASFAPRRGAEALSETAHLAYAAVGLALLVPALITLVRTRGRVRKARMLAGLSRDTPWSGKRFVLALLFELAAVPVWSFALQDALNDLWSRYPLLLDEDLHGQFAPPAHRDAARARRPALHEARLARIADELERPRARPLIALAFAMLCVGVFVWQVSQHGFFPNERDAVRVGAFASNLDGAWWRFWTSNVLHGGVDHLVGNMSLWVLVAVMVERIVGHARMVLLIVAGAAGTSAGMIVSAPHAVSLGASGVLFACFGIAVLLDPRARRPIGRFGWTFTVFGVCFSTFVPGVASGGHIGGLVAGMLVGLAVRHVWRPDAQHAPSLIGWPAPQAVDRTAPLAPDRELPVEARLRHLIERRNARQLTDDEFERLRTALLTRG
ncbi:MAG: rhomboid family intrarane serine protease [Thermoleophilia bacterium]|nr:rhomboid family intrarane serine protease [Thermoleophilia bacterium]